MVDLEFYRNSPEYDHREYKYFWYMPLFPDIDDQEGRIEGHGSNGYGAQENIEQPPNEPIPKDEFIFTYYVDGVAELEIHKAILTVIVDGEDYVSYDNLYNPDKVRLTFDNAALMLMADLTIYNEDGTPNTELTPSFHAVKCMLNELPSESVQYRIDIVDFDGVVQKSQEGSINIVPAPWEES